MDGDEVTPVTERFLFTSVEQASQIKKLPYIDRRNKASQEMRRGNPLNKKKEYDDITIKLEQTNCNNV